MASVISFTISMPISASQTLDQGIRAIRALVAIVDVSRTCLQVMRTRRSALGIRLSRQATSKTAIVLVAPKCSNKCISLVGRSCNCHKVNIRGHVYGFGPHPFSVSSSSSSVISGFWVGPDIEDGWGFVEAFVNQIF